MAATRSFFSFSSWSAACAAFALTSAMRSAVSCFTALSQPVFARAMDCFRLFSTACSWDFNAASPSVRVLLTSAICWSTEVLISLTASVMLLLTAVILSLSV